MPISIQYKMEGTDLVAKFSALPDAMMSDLQEYMQEFANLARDTAAERFAEVPRTHSPNTQSKMAQNVQATVTIVEAKVRVSLKIPNVPYARIQEQGGVVPPHVINAVNAQALAFMGYAQMAIGSLSGTRAGSSAYTGSLDFGVESLGYQTADMSSIFASSVVFRKTVYHPGGRIIGKHILTDTLKGLHDEFKDLIKQAHYNAVRRLQPPIKGSGSTQV